MWEHFLTFMLYVSAFLVVLFAVFAYFINQAVSARAKRLNLTEKEFKELIRDHIINTQKTDNQNDEKSNQQSGGASRSED